MSFFISLAFSVFLSFSVSFAEETSDAEVPPEVKPIVKPAKRIIINAEDEYFDYHRHDTTEKVEVLSKDRIEKANATSLNEAVDRMPGVDSQDYCVNCGAKRISINYPNETIGLDVVVGSGLKLDKPA